MHSMHFYWVVGAYIGCIGDAALKCFRSASDSVSRSSATYMYD